MKKFKLTTWVIVSVLIMITSCKKDEVAPICTPVINTNYINLSINKWYANYFPCTIKITLKGHDAMFIFICKNEDADTLFLKHYINGVEQINPIYYDLFKIHTSMKLISNNGVIFEKKDIQ